MRAVLLLSCCLLGCVLDTSLGNHRASEPAAELDGERRAPASASDAQVLDAAREAPPPSGDTVAGDAASEGDHPSAASEPDAADREPATEPEAAPEPMSDTPAEQHDAGPPMEDPPPPVEDPPVTMHACDTATDNPCLLCDQDACCEPRRACLESEACACHLECQRAENPAACRETCAAAGERYEPWLVCVREHCAQQCGL